MSLSLRKTEGRTTLIGTGVRFGSPSVDLGGFREIFERGAFAASLALDDIRVIWQHDLKFVFGRMRAGTARVFEDWDGMQYTADAPSAQWARDAIDAIARGDVTQNSFTFSVKDRKADEIWEVRGDGVYRIVKRVQLIEVGPQTHPAYPDTSVTVSDSRGAAPSLRTGAYERSSSARDASHYPGFRELARRTYPNLSEERAVATLMVESSVAIALERTCEEVMARAERMRRRGGVRGSAPKARAAADSVDAEVARQKAVVASLKRQHGVK